MQYLRLKWGTIKGWNNLSDESFAILKRYFDEPTAMGAAQRDDTDTQKAAICELIDSVDIIGNDWTGEDMTKDEAKAYVLNYGKD
jgi:hypothetical protein